MRIVFIGTGDIGVPTLRSLLHSRELVGVVTQPDKPVGRRQVLTPPPIKRALTNAAVPLLQPRRIKNDDAIAWLRELAPDVIVVMAYGQILPPSVLEIPTIACLNLHASLLPKHRGAAPIQAAIMAGDHETGITVMYMDEGLDTGDILLQSRVEIAPDETGGSLHDKLAGIAPHALADALQRVARGTAPRVAQDSAAATYAPKLEREHGRLDLHEAREMIERKIRAFDPWPGAFVMADERKLKVFRASLTADSPLRLQAIDGPLSILEAQLEGGRRMAAEELARGHPRLAAQL